MNIKELKEILNRYEEEKEVYLEFPARYKAVDADRIAIKATVLDVVPISNILAGEDKIVLLTDT